MSKIKKTVICCSVAVSVCLAPIVSEAQVPNFGAVLGAMGGGGNNGAGLAGAIIGVAMSAIIQQLNEQEMANRKASLQRAARGGSASWTSHRSGQKRAVKASYKKVGKVENGCQKVRETITLPDGKQGTSVETVCGLS